jgi:ABC-type nitrate/sulfonate/bicarbonate transport system substrate-binding protein
VALVACGPGSTSSGASSGAAKPAAPAAPTAASGGAAAAPSGQASAPAASAAPPAPVTLRLGQVTTTAMFWPIYVAQTKGLFQAENLTVEQIVFRVSSDATRAASSESVEIAGGTATDSVILADEQGNADLVAVAGALNKPTYSLIVRPEIKSFADLKGKTLGVSDLKDGSTTLLMHMLERGGLKAGDYDLIQAGGTPDRYAALKSGGVAGAMLTQPNDFQAIDEGYPSLGLVSDLIPDYQFTVHAVKRSWAQQNPDSMLRFLRAYAKACQWMYDPANKEEAIKILVDSLKTTDEYARRTYELMIEHAQALPKNGELNMAGMQGVMDIMVEMGNLPKPPPPMTKYVDTTWLDRARQ